MENNLAITQLKPLRKLLLADLFLNTRPRTLLFQVSSYRNLKCKNINVLVKTDKGIIERNMYSPQKQSSVYKNFVELYQSLK